MSSLGRILVTGADGFIGSHLVEALLAEGRPVRVVDNLATGYRANLAETPHMHDWTNWRNALDPHLTRLLAKLWPPR